MRGSTSKTFLSKPCLLEPVVSQTFDTDVSQRSIRQKKYNLLTECQTAAGQLLESVL